MESKRMGYNYNMKGVGAMSLLMAVVMVVSLTSPAMAQPTTATCAQKLTSCADYLKNSTNPPASCCNPIKEAVANELTCLCNLYTTPGFLESIGVNVTQALQLTKSCGVPVELSKCKTSAESPQSPSAPGVPGGNDGNGAERMKSVGIMALFLFCVSVMFY